MNILSLFDGMSCGMLALTKQNIGIDNYYASEVDKQAVGFTSRKHGERINHIGDVRYVDVKALPKIDLLIGGSPCQSFSFAGKRKGMATKCEQRILSLETYLELKDEGFEFEGQSYLFWEYMRILTELRTINPGIKFLLENVEMGEEWENVLSRAIGVRGIHINSALLSAQNRKRIYWCNWGMQPQGLFGDLVSIIPQPEDKGIVLRDILEPQVNEKYYLSDKAIAGILNHKAEQKEKGFGFGAVIKEGHEKMNAVKCGGKGVDDLVRVRQINPGKESGGKQPYQQNRIYDIEGAAPACHTGVPAAILVTENYIQWEGGHDIDNRANFEDGKSGTLDTKAGRQKVLLINEATTKGFIEIQPGECFDMEHPNSKTRRGRDMRDKSNTVMAKKTDFMQYTEDYRIRRLTPIEVCRLQTVPDDYFFDDTGAQMVSDTQIYKLCGNGWSIDVIAYLFSFLK